MGTDSSGTTLAPMVRFIAVGSPLVTLMPWFAPVTLILHQDTAEGLKMLLNQNCFGFKSEGGLRAKKTLSPFSDFVY